MMGKNIMVKSESDYIKETPLCLRAVSTSGNLINPVQSGSSLECLEIIADHSNTLKPVTKPLDTNQPFAVKHVQGAIELTAIQLTSLSSQKMEDNSSLKGIQDENSVRTHLFGG